MIFRTLELLGRSRWALWILPLLLTAGCAMPNSSNPTLSISSVKLERDAAAIEVVVSNPSEHALELKALDYTLVFGPLPVAHGRWTGLLALPVSGVVSVMLHLTFDTPPLDPSATEVELSGEMSLVDTGDEGEMGLKHAGFRAVAPVSPSVQP